MRVYLRFIIFSLAVLVAAGCQRNCGDCWEDTKTCGRHVGRGVLALFGKHPVPTQPCDPNDFAWEEEQEFIPFANEDLYGGIMRGEELALMRIDADTAIPQSRVDVGTTIPGVDGFYEPTGRESTLFRNIHFNTDDYSIRGAENLAAVRRIAAQLQREPKLYVFIEGHCDERGPSAYNLSLGTRRANAIRNALIKEGVNPDRLLTISYGKEHPIATTHDAGAWKINRRGQFKLHRQEEAAVCVR